MSHHLLNRQDAPFGAKVWELLDDAVIAGAKSQLSVRRIIDVEGPYGLGAKSFPMPDRATKERSQAGQITAELHGGEVIPLASIIASFKVASRDIAAYESTGIPFDASDAVSAGMASARQEESVLLYGSSALGTPGLLNVKGAGSYKLHAWTKVGAAADDLIAAITKLDEAGFPGPYALALEPALYNLLFRRYEHVPMTEYDHLKEVATGGVVKSLGIKEGGVLVATGAQYMSVVIGQDLMAGFVGPIPGGYELTATESVALRVRFPQAIFALKPA